MLELGLNYQNKLEIDITPNGVAKTWAEMKKGFANLAEGMNEVLYQASYLGDQGWGSTEVTGGQYIVTLTGVRYFGDAAQDWIFSDEVMYNFGDARKTTVRITRGNQAIIQWSVTLANITNAGGDANQPGAITVAVHGNGAPEILTDIYLDPLTVVSVSGSTSGDTAIYVNPALSVGNSYKYKIAATVDMPSYDDVLTTGWTEWNGTIEITATTGHQIVIAEVETATNKAKKAGRAMVTAMV